MIRSNCVRYAAFDALEAENNPVAVKVKTVVAATAVTAVVTALVWIVGVVPIQPSPLQPWRMREVLSHIIQTLSMKLLDAELTATAPEVAMVVLDEYVADVP